MSRNAGAYLLLAILCIVTRIITSVTYVEDPDSLRFALSLIDYDVANLRPHFPGYPVFCGIAKIFHAVTGNVSIAFALVGALALFLLTFFSLRFVGTSLLRPEGWLLALLLAFNPMIWLMSNRYMPDLLGTAIAVGVLALTIRNDRAPQRDLTIGLFLVGLLAGVRLSYLPLVAVPALIAFGRSRHKGVALAAMALGALLWFLPLVIDTGWDQLVEAGQTQTTGHFNDFGGTFESVPDMELRRIEFVRGFLAAGLGSYWDGRSALTLLVTLGIAVFTARGAWWLFQRETDGLIITLASIGLYTIWVLLYQNVAYQNRHVLPLIPFALMLIWSGAVAMFRSGLAPRALAVFFLTAYCAVGATIALQHREPVAIAQAADYLRRTNDEKRMVVSTSLVNFYLAGTGVEAEFVAVDSLSRGDVATRGDPHERMVYVIGGVRGWDNGRLIERRTFYHNPYVNTIWPVVPVYKMEGIEER